MVEHPVSVELDENSSDIELSLDVTEEPIPEVSNDVTYKKKNQNAESFSTIDENTIDASKNDLSLNSRIIETIMEEEEVDSVEAEATSCDSVSRSFTGSNMTPLEKMDTSTDETESCGVGNHVSVSSTKVNGFSSKESSDNEDELNCKNLRKSNSSLKKLLGNGSLNDVWKSKSENIDRLTEDQKSVSEETKKSSLDLPSVDSCDKPIHPSSNECRVNGDIPKPRDDGSESPVAFKRKLDADSGDPDSESESNSSYPEKRAKIDDSGNSSSYPMSSLKIDESVVPNGHSDRENSISSVASNNFPPKKRTTARKSTGGNAMKILARLNGDDRMKEQLEEADDIVISVENGDDSSSTDFVDADELSDERPLLLVDDGRQSPSDDGRRSPMKDGRQSPIEDGHQSPIEDSHQSPTEDGRQSPMKDGCQSLIDDGCQSPVDGKRLSPADEGRLSPVDEGRLSSADGKRLSPSDEGRLSPVNEKRSPAQDESRLSPLEKCPSSPVDERRSSTVDEVHQSAVDEKKYPVKINLESMSDENLRDVCKKLLKRMSRRQMEEIILQKCCEVVSESGAIGELKKRQSENDETEAFRKNKEASIEKQLFVLKAAADAFCNKARQLKENSQIPIPKIITRSVGLQVDPLTSFSPSSQATRSSSVDEGDRTSPSAVMNSRVSTTDTGPSSSCSSPTKSPRQSFSETVNTGKSQKQSLPTDNPAIASKSFETLPAEKTLSSRTPAKIPPAPSEDVIVDLTDLDDTADSPPRPTSALRNGLSITRLRQSSEMHVSPRHPAPLPPTPKSRIVPGAKLPPPKPNLSIQKCNLAIQMTWDLILNGDYEPIQKYQIYAYQETAGVPVSVTLWKLVGDVESLDLPMACTLTQFVDGYTYHFAVRAVDKHGRQGPFSCARSIAL